MTSKEMKKNRIMDYAFKKFTTIGIAQVTMDDIARGVGMGKGTLYKYFPSKEVLILDTIDFIVGQIENGIDNILSDEKMTMDQKLNLFMKTFAERLSKINPGVLEYLERSMPQVYEKIEHTREQLILKNLIRLLEDGKKSGLFDPNIDIRLVAHMLIGAVNHIVDSHLFVNTEYTFDKLFTSLTSILLNGCLSDDGRKSRSTISETIPHSGKGNIVY